MSLQDKFKITYITSDGRKISHDEMFAKPIIISYEENPELYERALLVYDPARLEKIRKHQKMYENTKERLAKLENEFNTLKNNKTNN